MACKYCVFSAESGSAWANTIQMSCTRYPTHTSVKAEHFCGEFKPKIRYCYDDLKSHLVFMDDIKTLRTLNDHWSDQCQELHTYKAEVKALRKLYKEQTGKNAVIRKKTE